MLNRKELLEKFNIYDKLIENKKHSVSDVDFFYRVLLDVELCVDEEFEFILTELSIIDNNRSFDFLEIFNLSRKLVRNI